MAQIMNIAVCLMVVIAIGACAPLESDESLKPDESLGLALAFAKAAKNIKFDFALDVNGGHGAYPAYPAYPAYGYGYPHYGGAAAAAAASGWGGAAAAAAAGK